MLRNDETEAPPSSRTAHPALEGVHAFLADMLNEGYRLKRLDHELFFKFFPPRVLMVGIGDCVIRGNILSIGRFIDERLAFDLSAEAGGELLEKLMQRKMVRPRAVLQFATPEVCARHLDRRFLWAFITMHPFWKQQRGTSEEQLNTEFVYLMKLFESGLQHNLLTADDIVEGIGVERIWAYLSPNERVGLLKRILRFGRDARAFSVNDLIASITLNSLVRRIPHRVLWQSVVNPKIEVAVGLGSIRPLESIQPPENGLRESPLPLTD